MAFKKQHAGFVIPKNYKVQFLDGKAFIELKAAARLAGIPESVLEMGQRLLKRPDVEGGIFLLATSELQSKANEIEAIFRLGLRKIAKALGSGGLTVKRYRDEGRLVFWYAVGPGKKRIAE